MKGHKLQELARGHTKGRNKYVGYKLH